MQTPTSSGRVSFIKELCCTCMTFFEAFIESRFLLVINQMGDKSYVGVTWRVLQSLFDWISSFSLIVLRVNKLKLFFFLCCVIFCQYKKTVVKCRKLLFSSRKSGSSLNSPRLMTIFFLSLSYLIAVYCQVLKKQCVANWVVIFSNMLSWKTCYERVKSRKS